MRNVCASVLLSLLCVGMACGDVANGKRIILETAGAVDAKWVERVVSFARENTGLDIQAMKPVEGEFASLNDVANAASAQLGEQDAFAVVLAGINTEEPAHGICLNDQRVAVINVTVLLADGPDEEQAGRRIERQVMQAVCMLIGMSACPNPQCVLWPYSTMEDLDAKGRNLCPPCYDQLRKKAASQGLSLQTLAVEEEMNMAAEPIPQSE
jgi:predicted Zn-dependent protease